MGGEEGERVEDYVACEVEVEGELGDFRLELEGSEGDLVTHELYKVLVIGGDLS